jgi:hypothetical protein
VLYPWHPAFGSDIDVLYEEQRRGETVCVCLLSNDSGVVIPKWMFSAAATSRMSIGESRPSLRALIDVRALLAEVGFHGGCPAIRGRAAEEDNAKVRQAAEGVTPAAAGPERRTNHKSRQKKSSYGHTPAGKAASRSGAKKRKDRPQ